MSALSVRQNVYCLTTNTVTRNETQRDRLAITMLYAMLCYGKAQTMSCGGQISTLIY